MNETCHDCGAKPGELHDLGCDVERCPDCGFQFIGCDHFDNPEYERIPWSGEWPGLAECREFGWYSIFWNGQWMRVDKDYPGSREDLNRLYMGECVWSADRKRWVLRVNNSVGALLGYIAAAPSCTAEGCE